MEWVETFSHDEVKPSENDGDLKLWFQMRYQFETCKISYHFCFDCYYWRPLHKSNILHKMHSYECDRTNNSHFLFKINSGIQLGDNQYFGFFANRYLFIWSFLNTFFRCFLFSNKFRIKIDLKKSHGKLF